MSGWWQGLSAREKALIASAGGLLALVIIWYGMVAPLLSGRSDALQARQQAADELAQLEHLSAASRARSSRDVPYCASQALKRSSRRSP